MPRLLGLLLLACLVFADPAVAQYTPDDAAGVRAVESYHHSDIDSINLGNGNLVVHIPLISYPQRGDDLKVDFQLLYNGRWTQGQRTCDENSGTCGNWRYQNSAVNGATFGSTILPIGVYPNEIHNMEGTSKKVTFIYNSYTYTNFIHTLYDGDGAGHILGNTGTSSRGSQGGSVTETGPWRALDGTGWLLRTDGTTSIDSKGTVYSPGNVTDANGNKMQYAASGLTDTLGRIIPAPPYATSQSNTDSSGCTGPLTITLAVLWTPPGYAGGTTNFKFCYASVSVYFKFPGLNYNNFQITLLQSVVLPNGTAYTFEYSDRDSGDGNNINYGSLTKITLPTGGSISYAYTTNQAFTFASQSGWDHNTLYANTRAIASRTVTDESGSHTWTYAGIAINPNSSETVTVADPDGNATTHQFNINYDGSTYETGTSYYQGSVSPSHLLKSVSTFYSNKTDTILQGETNLQPTSRTTTLDSGQVTKETYAYDPGFTFVDAQGLPSRQTIYGKITNTTVYDYGSGAPGPALRQTQTSYAWQSNSNILTANLLDIPSSVITTDGPGNKAAETDYSYDESGYLSSSGISTQHNSSPPNGVRGNPTTVSKWLSGGSNLVSHSNWYDTGVVYWSQDPNSNQTTFTYSGTFAGAYVTQTQRPTIGGIQHISSANYDLNTGLVVSRTDENNNPTTYHYDASWRMTEIDYPDNGQTILCYTDVGGSGCNAAGPPYKVVETKKVTSSLNLVSTLAVDDLGRLAKTELTSDPEGPDTVEITYDAEGRKATASNPHRSGSSTTDGVTSYVYDALGRTCVVVPPDGTPVPGSCPASQPTNDIFTVYSGNATYVYDQLGHARKTVTDGLGRMTQVFELPYSSNYETDYQYNVLDDLTSVTQKGSDVTKARTRSFAYDSLSRLTSTTNPESGTINYYYTYASGGLCAGDPSAVCRKIAPRPNQTGSATTTTTYVYDALNRIYNKYYDDGTPESAYRYDASSQWGRTVQNPIGRLGLASRANGSIGSVYSYDPMGRVNKVWNIVWVSNVAYSNIFSYNYNLDGTVATTTYPSGRMLTYTVSGAGRTTDIKDVANGVNYVTSGKYAPPGELLTMTNGSGIYTTNAYDKRLQPAILSAATSGNTIFSRSYDFHLGSGDNGNIYQIVNGLDSNRTQNFTYDNLNRVYQAYTSGPNWGETYTIDAWGNLTNIGAYGSKTNFETLNAAPASIYNQLPGFGYDSAGNLTSNGSTIYTYDGENQLVTTAGWTYSYDAHGQRIEKSSGSTGTIYARAAGDEALTETDLAGNILEEYILLNGKRVARRDGSSGQVYYYFSDHLGSSSVITDASGNVQKDVDYYPYGGEIVASGGDPNHYKFTGKERDSESGLDYFGARHYGSSLGRFMSVDPKAASGKLANPQSWNRYSYVLNNPLALFDPDGKEAYFAVQGNNINVQINVLLTGNATPKMAAAFQQSANRTLGGAHEATVNGQKYNLNIQVNASTDPKNLPNAQTRGQNTLNINNNAFKSEVNNDGKTGTAKTGDLEQGNVPGHESLHFAGLKDEYVPGAVNTVVNGATGESFQYQSSFVVPGTENNVMANPENPNAQLTQQNVNQLANTAVQMQQQAPAAAPEKKEEPQ